MILILHNIRSAYNVGSIFRTADAAGGEKIYLCGYTPAPASWTRRVWVRWSRRVEMQIEVGEKKEKARRVVAAGPWSGTSSWSRLVRIDRNHRRGRTNSCETSRGGTSSTIVIITSSPCAIMSASIPMETLTCRSRSASSRARFVGRTFLFFMTSSRFAGCKGANLPT